jgi:hypothetical protein
MARLSGLDVSRADGPLTHSGCLDEPWPAIFNGVSKRHGPLSFNGDLLSFGTLPYHG